MEECKQRIERFGIIGDDAEDSGHEISGDVKGPESHEPLPVKVFEAGFGEKGFIEIDIGHGEARDDKEHLDAVDSEPVPEVFEGRVLQEVGPHADVEDHDSGGKESAESINAFDTGLWDHSGLGSGVDLSTAAPWRAQRTGIKKAMAPRPSNRNALAALRKKYSSGRPDFGRLDKSKINKTTAARMLV